MDRALAMESAPSGRERELALLVHEHDEARERQAARFAFVHGPSGVGKSYLFSALKRSFGARGVILSGGPSSVLDTGSPRIPGAAKVRTASRRRSGAMPNSPATAMAASRFMTAWRPGWPVSKSTPCTRKREPPS